MVYSSSILSVDTECNVRFNRKLSICTEKVSIIIKQKAISPIITFVWNINFGLSTKFSRVEFLGHMYSFKVKDNKIQTCLYFLKMTVDTLTRQKAGTTFAPAIRP